MSSPQAVARTIRLFKDRALSPQALSENLARQARDIRDDLIAKGQASRNYRTYVDGREGVSEDRVKPDGAIVYQFSNLGRATIKALAYLVSHSPIDSGDFAKSWVVAVNGKPWLDDLNDIPARSVVMVLNPLPYSRKVDTGHMLGMSVPPQIIEAARRSGMRDFPLIDFNRALLQIPAGMVSIPQKFGPVPYILKGHQFSTAKKHAIRMIATGLRRVPTNRKDLHKGEQLTYPALVITEKK